VVLGLSGAMSNVSVGRRAMAAGMADDCHGFLLEQMQHHSTTTPPRKRGHSAMPATLSATTAAAMDTSSPSPPSHKRVKLDDSISSDL